MAVHQLKDGRWYVEYRIKGTNRKKREYFSRGIEGETAARERFAKLGVNEYNRQRTPRRPTTPSFETIALSYLQAKTGNMSQSSFDALYYKLKGIIFPEIGELPVARLTNYRMDQYKNKRLATPVTVKKWVNGVKKRVAVKDKDGKPRTIKATTVHREITDIQAILIGFLPFALTI